MPANTNRVVGNARKNAVSRLEREAMRLKREEERKRNQVNQRNATPKSLAAILEEKNNNWNNQDLTELGWRQYSPFRAEKPRQKRFLNTASIWVFARKVMAEEWRKAKGVKRPDPTKVAMERYALEWDKKKEEERIREQRAAEEGARRERKEAMLEAMLGESVELFAAENQRLKAEREEQKAVTRLFQNALDAVGTVLELHRSDGGWIARMEPWEERRARRLRGDWDSPPVVYEIRMGKDYYITSCTGGGDPLVSRRVLTQLNNELDRRIRKPLELQALEGKVERPRPITDIERELLEQEREREREVTALLEQALEDFGRVMKVSRTDDGFWKARIELWEEMGMRRRKPGTPPLLFDVKIDDELKVVSYEGV